MYSISGLFSVKRLDAFSNHHPPQLIATSCSRPGAALTTGTRGQQRSIDSKRDILECQCGEGEWVVL